MVMGQFVTTYRKDYLWPYVKSIGIKPAADSLYQPQYKDPQVSICPCHCLDKREEKFLGPKTAHEQSWSRQGPMGPLLDPKLYPAKVGRSPEVETMRFNQPNVFLKKLQEKYPYIYEVLRTAPPDDLISRINRDRMRTTYQVDYLNLKEYPSAPYDQLLRSAGIGGIPPCSEPVKLPGDPCRPNQRPIAFRPSTISKGGPCAKSERKCGKGIHTWDPFDKDQSKYDKIIRTWGQMLYRDTLHAHSNLSAMRSILARK